MLTMFGRVFIWACLGLCLGQVQQQVLQYGQNGYPSSYEQPQTQNTQYGQEQQQKQQQQKVQPPYEQTQYGQQQIVQVQYGQPSGGQPAYQPTEGVTAMYGQLSDGQPQNGQAQGGKSQYGQQNDYQPPVHVQQQVIPYGTPPPPPEASKKAIKSVMCYSCSYTPDRMVFQMMREVDGRSADGKPTSYKTRLQERMVKGGWKPCVGPFNRAQAMQTGIGAIPCTTNCYTRVDKAGNLLRGCLNGEYGVDPNTLGCRIQGGVYYCFCKGDYCNTEGAPTFPDNLG